jgi:hypothetical protein
MLSLPDRGERTRFFGDPRDPGPLGLGDHRLGDGRCDVAVEDARDDVVLVQVVSSVIEGAPASIAPRNTPGKARTLLIWFG